MRSDAVKKGMERIPHRALLRACGLRTEDFEKPLVAIANSWNEAIPGHFHMMELYEEIAAGVREAGGVPLGFGVPSICDGVAMNVEMRYSLPSRELVADSIEAVVRSHSYDGWVGLTNCDKITPGMLMACGRLDIPSIIATGGPMRAGRMGDERLDVISCFEAVGRVKAGTLSEEDAEKVCELGCPGPGSCAGLFTANSMAYVTEALGMSLTGSASVLAEDPKRREIARESGWRIVGLIEEDMIPSKIMTENAFDNAIRMDMAIGGSSNTVLHLPAIAIELGIEIEMERFDAVSRETPNICSIRPFGPYFMEDLHEAGGVPGILSRLVDDIKPSQTVSGIDITEVARKGVVHNDEVIRTKDNAFHPEGGIGVLKGNLAPMGSVVKMPGVPRNMLVHRGPARVFDNEQDSMEAILSGSIKAGDVVIIRYVGVRGAPGMPEMLSPTSSLVGMGMIDKVGLITDGRFSGGTRGLCIGHTSPEAADAGPIAALRDGDMVSIDIPGRSLNVGLTDGEIEARMAQVRGRMEEIASRSLGGYLARYSRMAGPADKGASLDG